MAKNIKLKTKVTFILTTEAETAQLAKITKKDLTATLKESFANQYSLEAKVSNIEVEIV